MGGHLPEAIRPAMSRLRQAGWRTTGNVWTIALPESNWGRIWLEPGLVGTGFGAGIVCGAIASLLEGRDPTTCPGAGVIEHLTLVARTDVLITSAGHPINPPFRAADLRADQPAVQLVRPEDAEAWWSESLAASARLATGMRSSADVCRMLLSTPKPSLLDARYAALLAALDRDERLLEAALRSADEAYADVAATRLTRSIDRPLPIRRIGRLTHRSFVSLVESVTRSWQPHEPAQPD